MPISQIRPANSLLASRIWETGGIFPKFVPHIPCWRGEFGKQAAFVH